MTSSVAMVYVMQSTVIWQSVKLNLQQYLGAVPQMYILDVENPLKIHTGMLQ